MGQGAEDSVDALGRESALGDAGAVLDWTDEESERTALRLGEHHPPLLGCCPGAAYELPVAEVAAGPAGRRRG
jgi:hypothetical protein